MGEEEKHELNEKMVPVLKELSGLEEQKKTLPTRADPDPYAISGTLYPHH